LNTVSVAATEKVREMWPQKAHIDMLSQGTRRQRKLSHLYEVLSERKSNGIHTRSTIIYLSQLASL